MHHIANTQRQPHPAWQSVGQPQASGHDLAPSAPGMHDSHGSGSPRATGAFTALSGAGPEVSVNEANSPALKYATSWSGSPGVNSQNVTSSSLSEPVGLSAVLNQAWTEFAPEHQGQEQEQLQHQQQQRRQQTREQQEEMAGQAHASMTDDLDPDAGLAMGQQHSMERKYVRYHMQRLQTTANHVLFYVVDAEEQAHLAIVGTDVRLSGHFVYCSLPGFKDGPPVRCTNRVKVMEWLAAMGATDCADPDRVKVPAISREQLDMLLTSDPMFSKPKMDREYSSWREEGGRLPDGRHFKAYFLLEADTRAEKLVITAEDSHRRDRRYAYKAVADMGGFAFENGQAVKEWLDFVVGRTPAGPLARPITRTRNNAPQGRSKTNGPKMPSWKSAQQITQLAPEPGAGNPSAGLLPPETVARQAVAAAAAATSSGSRLGDHGGQKRNLGQTGPTSNLGRGGLALDSGDARGSMAAGIAGGGGGNRTLALGGGEAVVAPSWVSTAPQPHASSLRLVQMPEADMGLSAPTGNGPRAAPAGSVLSNGPSHGVNLARGSVTSEPAGTLRSSSSLQNPAPVTYLPTAAPAAGGLRYTSLSAPGPEQPSSGRLSGSANINSLQQQQQQQQPVHQPGAAPTIVHLEPLRPLQLGQPAQTTSQPAQPISQLPQQASQPGSRTTLLVSSGSLPKGQTVMKVGRTGPDVAAAFNDDSKQSDWVMAVPGPADVARFEMWCGRLGKAAGAQEGNVRAAEDALVVLGELGRERVNLRLLEATKAGAAVSTLCNHYDPRVAGTAAALAASWRAVARSALAKATSAMERPSGTTQNADTGPTQQLNNMTHVQQTGDPAPANMQTGNGAVSHAEAGQVHAVQANGSMQHVSAPEYTQHGAASMQHANGGAHMQQTNGGAPMHYANGVHVHYGGSDHMQQRNSMPMRQPGEAAPMQHSGWHAYMPHSGNAFPSSQRVHGPVLVQHGSGNMSMQYSGGRPSYQHSAGSLSMQPASAPGLVHHGSGPMHMDHNGGMLVHHDSGNMQQYVRSGPMHGVAGGTSVTYHMVPQQGPSHMVSQQGASSGAVEYVAGPDQRQMWVAPQAPGDSWGA